MVGFFPPNLSFCRQADNTLGLLLLLPLPPAAPPRAGRRPPGRPLGPDGLEPLLVAPHLLLLLLLLVVLAHGQGTDDEADAAEDPEAQPEAGLGELELLENCRDWPPDQVVRPPVAWGLSFTPGESRFKISAKAGKCTLLFTNSRLMMEFYWGKDNFYKMTTWLTKVRGLWSAKNEKSETLQLPCSKDPSAPLPLDVATSSPMPVRRVPVVSIISVFCTPLCMSPVTTPIRWELRLLLAATKVLYTGWTEPKGSAASTLIYRAGHFRYFLIFSIIKND